MTPVVSRPNYLNVAYGIKSWLLTVDHKRIAILYLVSVTAMFAIGGAFAAAVRLELLTPSGDLFQSETYNKLFTMHGIVMVFFFLIPSVPAVLGNFLLPIMIGARDLAFPKINLLSWYIFIIGAAFTMYAIIAGGVDTGWTFYTPYSTKGTDTQVLATGLGVFITGFSSILTGLNFIVTVHKMRAPGLTWMRLPLFVWAHYATSIIMILGTPVIAVTVLLVAVERVLKLGFFDPALGGDPVLFQHMFWFYSHPAVYIMILPSMGVISELVSCFSRKRVYGYPLVAMSSMAIAIIGFLVWGHHMFVTGQSAYLGIVFAALSFLVAIPSAIKVFNWTATLYKGSISYDTPMLYAFGFIGLFTIGGLTGLFLAALGLDIHVHDTYFVVAHFHYVMVGGVIMGYLGGLHFWWPKISGRMYPEGWAKLSALIIFIGFNLTFFPQFLVGYQGMPRRYHAYPPEFQVLNVMSSAGASILAVGYLLPIVYFTWSMRYGPVASANPWGAKGLEWETQSPPVTENFPTQPVVKEEAYEYAPPPAPLGGGPLSSAAHTHDAHGHAAHPRHVHHFESLATQKEASTFGMWVFIVQEVMFFGGLFLLYTLYRALYPAAFQEGSHQLNWKIGTFNTIVLIGSSLTMAMAVHAAAVGKRGAIVLFLILTILLGGVFLGVKVVEYKEKFDHHLIPGHDFQWGHSNDPAHPQSIQNARAAEIYFSLYFTMTGLHALHMIIGIPILAYIAFMAWRGDFSPEWHTPVEITGLYWHFVDIVWIFLFPFLYLIT